MSITLGKDIDSSRSIRLLGEVRASVGKTFERLSSGLRINSASDDAAGLAQFSTLDAKRRISQVAIRNVNDGLSALSILDGSLNQQTQIVTRLRELAEQSANGGFNDSQRLVLDKEYQQLVQELGRLAAGTKFNDLSLMRAGRAGALREINLQAGLNGSDSSGITLRLSDLGALSGTLQLGSPDRTGSTVTSDPRYGVPDGTVDSTDFFYSLDFIASNHDLSDLMNFYDGQLINFQTVASNGSAKDLLLGFYSFGTDIFLTAWERTATGDYRRAGSAASTLDLTTGLVANLNPAINATFEDGSSRNFNVDLFGLRIFSGESSDPSPTTTLIDASGVRSASQSLTALEISERKLAALTQLRGTVGAYQSRLGAALSSLTTFSDVTAEASARIKDADIASETAKLLSLQIREQSSALALRSSKNQGEIVLQLLQA